MKARLAADGAELVGWNPGGDIEVGQPGEVEAQYRRPDLTIDYRYHAVPGRIHVYPDERLFHVSWIGTAKAVTGDVEVGAVAVWAVAEGQVGFRVEESLEAVAEPA
ncbi:MAG TPA: hypothetical protein VI854_01820 [Acidimicrobiia bacterium]|nr:hypothetical protein [Acidimicrobiia bacterium]